MVKSKHPSFLTYQKLSISENFHCCNMVNWDAKSFCTSLTFPVETFIILIPHPQLFNYPKKKDLLIEDMRNIRIDEKPLCLWLFQFMRKQLGWRWMTLFYGHTRWVYLVFFPPFLMVLKTSANKCYVDYSLYQWSWDLESWEIFLMEFRFVWIILATVIWWLLWFLNLL